MAVSNRVFSDIDALDTKFAQIIALDGLIISFVFLKTSPPHFINLFILGLVIILSSMTIGILSFSPKEFSSGPHHSFYKKYDIYPTGEGIKVLRDKLVDGYLKNLDIHNQKSELFKYMLITLLIGLIFLLLGYFG
jgi:hypothetical protein